MVHFVVFSWPVTYSVSGVFELSRNKERGLVGKDGCEGVK